MPYRRITGVVTALWLLVWCAAPARGAVSVNQIEDYLKRMGVAYLQHEGESGFVINYEGKNAHAERVTVFVVNDEAKNVLDCYAYANLKLHNIRQARDQAAVMARLLKLNHKAFGTFFVDDEGDIGVRFTFTTEDGVGFDSFKMAVETLRRVADNTAPTINRLLAADAGRY